MEQELVSIIISAYNASEFLDGCISSAIAQTYRTIEIILIDDGSTDETLSIMRKHEASDSRIRVLTQENMGLGASRNTGISLARGKAIMFLDADDYYTANLVEYAFSALKRNDCDIVIFNGNVFWDDRVAASSGVPSEASPEALSGVPPEASSEVSSELPVGIPIQKERYFRLTNEAEGFVRDGFYFLELSKGRIQSACLKIYRKDFIDSNIIRFAQEGYGEDTLFFYHAFIKAVRVSYIDYAGYLRRFHKNSIMKSVGTENIKSRICHFPMLLSVLSEVIDKKNSKLVMKQYVYYGVLLWIMIYNRGNREERDELDECFRKLGVDKLIIGNRTDLATCIFSVIISLPKRLNFIKSFVAKLAKKLLKGKTRFSF